MSKTLYLSAPYLIGNEKKYINKCIKDNWISTGGKFINLFENKLSNFLNIKYAIGCINGTSALHIALKVLGIKKNDEVLVPTLTFIAPVNSIIYNGGKPIFFDCDETCNLDIRSVIDFINTETFFKKKYSYNKKTKRRIFGIIIVHVFGNAVNLEPLIKICKQKNIKIIEDASESFGTYYKKGKIKNKYTGTIGDIGCFSFNGNKILTSGSGGMIVCNNKKLANKAKYLINQAKNNSFEYIHDEVGYNYRISNIHSAIGLAQIENIKLILRKKMQINKYYKKELSRNPKAILLTLPDYSKNNNWMNVITFKNDISKLKLKKIYNIFERRNIQVRKIWYPNHLQKPYLHFQRYKISKAEIIQKYSLCLPSSPNLEKTDIKKILKIINI